MAAVRRADDRIGRVLDLIETDPHLRGRTALIVTADPDRQFHGCEAVIVGRLTEQAMAQRLPRSVGRGTTLQPQFEASAHERDRTADEQRPAAVLREVDRVDRFHRRVDRIDHRGERGRGVVGVDDPRHAWRSAISYGNRIGREAPGAERHRPSASIVPSSAPGASYTNIPPSSSFVRNQPHTGEVSG